MSRWQVQLEGDRMNVANLSKWLEGSAHTIEEREGQIWLSSTEFEALESSDEVHKKAADIARSLTHYVTLRDARPAPNIQVGHIVEMNSDGTKKVSIVIAAIAIASASATVSGIGVVIDSNGKVVEPPADTMPSFDRFRNMLATDRQIARAAELMRTPSHDFASLNKVYEIIRFDVDPKGDWKALTKWVSEDELRRFHANKDDHRLSGDLLARHTKPMKGAPKAGLMTIREAQDVIQRIYEQWVRSKNI